MSQVFKIKPPKKTPSLDYVGFSGLISDNSSIKCRQFGTIRLQRLNDLSFFFLYKMTTVRTDFDEKLIHIFIASFTV